MFQIKLTGKGYVVSPEGRESGSIRLLSGFRFAGHFEKPLKTGLFSTAKFTLAGDGCSQTKPESAYLKDISRASFS